MAKKSVAAAPVAEPPAKPQKQLKMQGEGFPEPPPKEVEDAATEFITRKREAAGAKDERDAAEEKLIELMEKHKISEYPIDQGEKTIVLMDRISVQVKAKKKQKPDEGGGDE